ncbi:MAG: hypothetical protein PHU64_07300 [Candidatus Omnitrophica bacterium]|nr:hypothetical protein [Candidatus Omnitrophota bacterium]MDD5429774.1 hypothetical protein [Candidatus Omnitrophota bacterium]
MKSTKCFFMRLRRSVFALLKFRALGLLLKRRQERPSLRIARGAMGGLILCFFLTNFAAYSQETLKNPFESLLPKDEKNKSDSIKKKADFKADLKINLEGVIWGSDTPQAIIDGEVYKIGDKLKKADASVFRITKNVVFIAYNGKIYEIKMGKKEAK